MSAASLPANLRRALPALEGEAGAAVRLALAEALLTSDDARECAQVTVDWLVERAGARRAACALLDAGTGKVQSTVAHGVPQAQLSTLTIALQDPQDPLVFALAGPEPVSLGRKRRGPFSQGDLLALPLPVSEQREARVGLLLVSLPRPPLEGAVH